MVPTFPSDAVAPIQAGPRSRLRARMGGFDGAFAKLAQWLLQLKPAECEMSQFTTGEIARRLGVSRPTVVRFCQYLGYSGFADFRAAWIEETIRLQDSLIAKATLPDVAAKVAEMTTASMKEALLTLNVQEFERAVVALCRAGMIVLYGYVDSYFLAESVEHKLIRAGKHAKAIGQDDALLTQGQFLKPGDILIVISQSGARVKVLDAVASLRGMGVTVVLVTSQAHSPLARVADIMLLTSARDVTVANLPVTLRAPQSMVLDMLVLEMVSRLGKPSIQLCEPKLALTQQPANPHLK